MTDHDRWYFDHCDNIVGQCVCVCCTACGEATEVDVWTARILVSQNKRQSDDSVSQTYASDFPCFPCNELLLHRVVLCTQIVHTLLLQILSCLNRLSSWLSNDAPWPLLCTCAPASQVLIFVGRECSSIHV